LGLSGAFGQRGGAGDPGRFQEISSDHCALRNLFVVPPSGSQAGSTA
jgi:hypothetical protein